MGEIVDLDKYRRRRKRRAQEARTASRQRRSASPTRERTRPAVDTSAPTPAEPDSVSGLDPDDRTSE